MTHFTFSAKQIPMESSRVRIRLVEPKDYERLYQIEQDQDVEKKKPDLSASFKGTKQLDSSLKNKSPLKKRRSLF